MNSGRTRFHPLLLLILPLLFGGCDILRPRKQTSLADFRQVQARYESATRADNLDQGGTEGGGQAAYTEVIGTLTPAFIQGLPEKTQEQPDDRLKPNAWMMRGVSEWRTNALKPAISSAGNGLSAGPQVGSRDHILLLMLPALVTDSEIVGSWQAAGQALTPEAYPKVADDYQTALSKLAQAEAAFGPATGDDTKKMFYLHKKRLLLNWDKVIRTLSTDAEAKKQAKADAGSHLGVPTLFDAVIAVNTELARLSGR